MRTDIVLDEDGVYELWRTFTEESVDPSILSHDEQKIADVSSRADAVAYQLEQYFYARFSQSIRKHGR